MRNSRQDSDLIKKFADETGLAVRSAQWHRATDSERWRQFLARNAPVALEVAASGAVANLAAGGSPEATMLRTALETWESVAALVRRARQQGHGNLPAFLKAEREAQKSYREAKRAHELQEVASGRLRPASEFAELQRLVLIPLRNVIANMPRELGPRCNPFDHAFAIEAADEWVKDRFTPQLEAAINRVARFEAAPAGATAPEGGQGGPPVVSEGEAAARV